MNELLNKISWVVKNIFNNVGNKTTNNHYPEVDKEQLKDYLLTIFSHKKSYEREEIADKINKLL